MDIKIFIPHPALKDIVFGISTINASLPSGIQEVSTPYPPTPFQSLMFYCNQPIQMSRIGNDFHVQPLCVVVGPQFSRVNIKVKGKLSAIRVDFFPGALHRFAGISMHELFDEGLDAADLFGNEILDIREQLQNIQDPSDGVAIVENFLVKQLPVIRPHLPFDDSISELLRSDGNLRIESLASLACLSLKQFERKCKERIGMPPKMFSRIVRFSRAYRLHELRPELNWTSIAYESGYFDQMHMIRDFREFSGVNPTILEKELLHTPFRMQKILG